MSSFLRSLLGALNRIDTQVLSSLLLFLSLQTLPALTWLVLCPLVLPSYFLNWLTHPIAYHLVGTAMGMLLNPVVLVYKEVVVVLEELEYVNEAVGDDELTHPLAYQGA